MNIQSIRMYVCMYKFVFFCGFSSAKHFVSSFQLFSSFQKFLLQKFLFLFIIQVRYIYFVFSFHILSESFEPLFRGNLVSPSFDMASKDGTTIFVASCVVISVSVVWN